MLSITNTMPEAYAKIKGNKKYPNLKGTVSFYGVHGGTIVVAEVTGLPENSTFHGFHIHEGENCTAFGAFYTDRFYPEDVIGRTVIVHENADDFRTQPSGNSGAMIACGKIVRE